MPRMKLSERFTGGLHVQILSEVTSVKDGIREWNGVFHNHSAIYAKYKNVVQRQHLHYKDDMYNTWEAPSHMSPPDFLKEGYWNNRLVGGIGGAVVRKLGKEGENEQSENGREERKRNEGLTCEGGHKGVAEQE
jgi:hypothetical protein